MYAAWGLGILLIATPGTISWSAGWWWAKFIAVLALPGYHGALSYQHLPTLGGLRHRKKDAAPSLNTFWQVTAFRNYADYASTDAFRTGLNELRALSRDNCCAIMCAEAVWWRCHRRIIADYLLAQGVPVMHIMGGDKIDPAKLTPGAQALPDGTLVYQAADEAAQPTDWGSSGR